MDFYAEDIDELPSLSYIALVGPCPENIGDEILGRVRRIKKANPSRKSLALDIRGISDVTANHYDEFQKIHDTLNQMNWDFYICNVPSRLQNIFFSRQFERNLNVFNHKRDLLQHLENAGATEQITKKNNGPMTVIFRTTEGIRLFEAEATDYEKPGQLVIFTEDKNANIFKDNGRTEANLYFDSKKLQLLPQKIKITECKKTDHEDYNYRLTVKLTNISESDFALLENYFES